MSLQDAYHETYLAMSPEAQRAHLATLTPNESIALGLAIDGRNVHKMAHTYTPALAGAAVDLTPAGNGAPPAAAPAVVDAGTFLTMAPDAQGRHLETLSAGQKIKLGLAINDLR